MSLIHSFASCQTSVGLRQIPLNWQHFRPADGTANITGIISESYQFSPDFNFKMCMNASIYPNISIAPSNIGNTKPQFAKNSKFVFNQKIANSDGKKYGIEK